jgi:hypothetical protein
MPAGPMHKPPLSPVAPGAVRPGHKPPLSQAGPRRRRHEGLTACSAASPMHRRHEALLEELRPSHFHPEPALYHSGIRRPCSCRILPGVSLLPSPP